MHTFLNLQAIGFISVGLVLTIVCLVLAYQKRYTNALMVLSIVLFLFVWPTTFFSVTVNNLERSKTVEFCASCHEMGEKVKDLRNPKSKTLAARHATRFWVNKNQCYTCHTDYTMFGPVEAKLKGLGHMFVALTQDVKPNDIKVWAPFPDRNCLQCHHTRRFDNIEEHGEREADERCISCHEEVHP